MKPCLAASLLVKAAKQAQAALLLEPEFGFAGQITLRSGRRHYFKDSCLDINPAGAVEIARDKHYSTFFLNKLGYSTIEGDVFFSTRFASLLKLEKAEKAAITYAKTLGFPLVIKPNDLSQGIGVSIVHNAAQLKRAIAQLPARSRTYLVQRKVSGNDYRIVILDGKLVCAYRREPLSVTGNGKDSIRALLMRKQAELARKGYDASIDLKDTRIHAKLATQKLSLVSVPTRGKTITLLDNANLSTGGSAADVTDTIHASYVKLAANITRDMGLRLCGVDIMTQGVIEKRCGAYHVVEINASPGLDHYALLGQPQRKRVEALYADILKALADA